MPKTMGYHLFQDVNHPKVAVMKLDSLNQAAIEAQIAKFGATSYVTESDEFQELPLSNLNVYFR